MHNFHDMSICTPLKNSGGLQFLFLFNMSSHHRYNEACIFLPEIVVFSMNERFGLSKKAQWAVCKKYFLQPVRACSYALVTDLNTTIIEGLKCTFALAEVGVMACVTFWDLRYMEKMFAIFIKNKQATTNHSHFASHARKFHSA